MENGDELSASGMGFSGKIKGRDTLIIILVLAVVIAATVFTHVEHADQEEKFTQMLTELRKSNEFIYLMAHQLSRPQDERVPIKTPPQLWKYLDDELLREKERSKR